jgi:hypothetical protein
LFGNNSIIFTKPFNIGFFKGLAFLLYKQSDSNAGFYFIIPLILLCILNLFKLKIYFVSDLAIWFLVININNQIYPTLTGGDYLLNQLLFFSCFINDKYKRPNNQVKMVVHNLGVLLVMIQICLVYFFAAFAKLTDQSWLSGNAVYFTSQINHYSLPFILNNLSGLGFLFKLLNYLVITYQILFPFVVWIKKIKKPFIVVGIVMHLYIAFVMGLVSFGLIMIIPYIFFWPGNKSTSINN